MEQMPAESKNPLKSEHLNEGVQPIMACVGIPRQYKTHPGKEKDVFFVEKPDVPGTYDVNFFEYPHYLEKQNFKHCGLDHYVISTVDACDKFSRNFFECVGLVVTGQNKTTGENISFLSHLAPSILGKGKQRVCNNYIIDLKNRLEELREQSAEGTIDAVVFAGSYHKDKHFDPPEYDPKKYYDKLIGIISGSVTDNLGFEPVVVTNPKMVQGTDNAYYENKSRKLYIMRPDAEDQPVDVYLPSDLEQQKKKWQ